jgi:hypothetical protein
LILSRKKYNEEINYNLEQTIWSDDKVFFLFFYVGTESTEILGKPLFYYLKNISGATELISLS